MNRRGFLAGLGALVGGVVLEQAIPLGRVWSFPSQIVVPSVRYRFTRDTVELLRQQMDLSEFSKLRPIKFYAGDFAGVSLFYSE